MRRNLSRVYNRIDALRRNEILCKNEDKLR